MKESEFKELQEYSKIVRGWVKKQKHRIPYDVWINSQLSIARHYGGCQLNGKTYKLDYYNGRRAIVYGKERFYPDLVEV